MTASKNELELLAPAGNWECARAAIANGADAIYFGLNCGFNARARADNFSVQDLPELLQFLHRHSVKGYVTLNTLVFTEELEAAETLIREIALARVDAVLVQDLGLVQLIREVAPELPIHASTQMTMTSAETIHEVEPLGIERVVLAREMSVSEIGKVHKQTTMPLEAFVHGALCVAYSGQCLTSESLGGRSANRGQCAQACRLPYELICDGEKVDLGAQKYLLSPQDLAAYALIPELLAAGVVSFKIEGRLKTPEYVANITRHYRQAIDSAVAGQPVEFTQRQIEDMELSFSRGFSVGWLKGCDHKALVPATSSAKQGVRIGTISGFDLERQQVFIELAGSLKAGDGIVFAGDRLGGREQGGRIFAVFRQGKRLTDLADRGTVSVDFYQHSVDLSRLEIGQAVWKNDDPALTTRLRKSFSGDIPARPVPISLQVRAVAGQPLQLDVQIAQHGTFSLMSEQPLQLAVKHPLTVAVLREQLGRLGGTGFELADLQAEIQGQPMLPLSQIGLLRRQLVSQLQELEKNTVEKPVKLAESPVLPRLRSQLATCAVSESGQPELIVLCRSLYQLETMLNFGQQNLYADFQDIREYRQAVDMAREQDARLFLATPRIQKPGEMGIFKAMGKHRPDGLLVRNLSALRYFRDLEFSCVADFSLNAANELTVDWLLKNQAQRVTVSYDLNQDQLLGLLDYVPTNRLELVVHQHMPMFHMEHCVFCAMLSPGTNKTNCGRPCDEHLVELRDRVGAEHPLKADVGCRNTVFNKTPQSGADVVGTMLERGVRTYRIEFLQDQPAAELQKTVRLYQALLAGEVNGEEVWRSLQAMNRVGVTRGTLEHNRDPLAIL